MIAVYLGKTTPETANITVSFTVVNRSYTEVGNPTKSPR